MGKTGFIIEKDKLELFLSLVIEVNCKVISTIEKDKTFSYVIIEYSSIKNIFMLGFNYGAYAPMFQQN